jgi:hypothetical protein
MDKKFCAATVCLTSALVASPSLAEFSISGLPPLAMDVRTVVRALNNEGLVVGSSGSQGNPGKSVVVWTNQQPISVFDAPPDGDSQAIAISSAGAVLGIVGSLSQGSFGFVADQQGITPLPAGVSSMNDLGQIVGGVEVGPDNQAFAAKLVDRKWVVLPGAEPGSYLHRINNAGEAMGIWLERDEPTGPLQAIHGIRYAGDQVEVITVPGYSYFLPYDINEHGTIVGRAVVGEYEQQDLVLLHRDGSFDVVIKAWDFPTEGLTGLNDHNDILIDRIDPTSGLYSPYILPGDGSPAMSLREQLGAAGEKWTRLSPRDINNSRTIVGDGELADGRWLAWVASPIPEPAMIGVVAMLGLTIRRVR